jgi:DNA (cytosine-5)-methyltransferase 1
MPSFYEFFAGGGMARTGLGRAWKCEFANDISPMKATAYRRNFKEADGVFAQCDINALDAESLPGRADLIWASFPCQDLSLAGSGKGLKGSRSGLIWSLLDITRKLKQQGRGPKAIVLENVVGLLNSKNGQDFYDILGALRKDGFIFGTLMMDAVHFLPHFFCYGAIKPVSLKGTDSSVPQNSVVAVGFSRWGTIFGLARHAPAFS